MKTQLSFGVDAEDVIMTIAIRMEIRSFIERVRDIFDYWRRMTGGPVPAIVSRPPAIGTDNGEPE